MSYDYETIKPILFTEGGMRLFLRIRDISQELSKKAGAFTAECVIAQCTGDGWEMMACIDRLVELNEIVETPNPTSSFGQHRVFVPRR